MRPWRWLGFLLAALLRPSAVAAQVELAAQAWLAYQHVDRTPAGGPLGELKVVRPVVMARLGILPRVFARATIDFEGVTMPAGELWPGGWGEGFVDRRHPHTYVHELIVEAARAVPCPVGRCRVGAFAGKGFVAFGSADPMDRGFLRFPANHHLAQILERAVLGGQAAAGRLTIEATLFDGDEPERPGQWPRIGGRFGDSWAARLTLDLGGGLEASASIAKVASPEHRAGAGATQNKRHVGAAYLKPLGPGRLRLLGEWAETAELDRFFVFNSWLAEGEYRWGRVTARYRFERTDRPEEERLSPFRSARPHLENSILGVTRWRSHTAGLSLGVGGGRPGADLVVEATEARVAAVGGGVFDPVAVYGGTRVRSVSAGLRLYWGVSEHPMGRYGLRTSGHSDHHAGVP